jgi:hypothetical protein
MFNTLVKYFYVVLAMPIDDGQFWPKHAKANFYIPILNLLKLRDLVIQSCVKKHTGSKVTYKVVINILTTTVIILKWFCHHLM